MACKTGSKYGFFVNGECINLYFVDEYSIVPNRSALDSHSRHFCMTVTMLRLVFLLTTTCVLSLYLTAGDNLGSNPTCSSDDTSCPASSLYATVYPNGGGGSGKLVALADLDATKSYYTENGFKQDISNIKTNGTLLFEAPMVPGTHFMYPALEIGRVIETGVLSPKTKQPIELQVLSDSPRVFYVKDFMTDEETNELIDYAVSDKNPYKMAQSTGGTHKSWEQGGRNDVLTTRTSMNAFDISTRASHNIKKRAFELLRMPRFVSSMADGIQVLRYELGQAYIAHHDFFPSRQSPDFNWDPSKGGSNRYATVFLYLSNVEEGGQTCFPKAPRLKEPADLAERLGGAEPPSEQELAQLIKQANLVEGSWQAKLTRQCYTRFSVPPKKGDAVLFYSQTPNGVLDPQSLHGAGPVLKGTKWGANVWVWNACRYSQCDKDAMNPAQELDFVY